jgi:16S rRNA G1207 methylase RsmC
MSLDDLRIPSSERLLVAALDEFDGRPARVLCTSLGRGQIAVDLAERFPKAAVTCAFLDLYPAGETRELLAEQGSGVTVVCSSDLPGDEVDLCVLPVARGGEAELSRDLLQQGLDRLRVGGTLLAAVDNRKDVWLQHEIEKLQKGVTRMPSRWGVAYRLTKKGPLKRLRDFRCEFAFRDGERLVKAVSRPGVFSHRKLDVGARAMLEAMEVKPGMKVLDMGCGSGAVGLAAALRAEGVTVHGVDSTARAVECLLAGAELNGISDRVTAQHEAEGKVTGKESFDLAVGNPPYYSHYTIAELFLQGAKRGLKPGGEVLMVTKNAEWFVARMGQLFEDVATLDVRGYVVVTARKPARS